MQYGIDTFGISKLLLKDNEGTLKKLKQLGITAIEPTVVFSENEKSEEALKAHKEAERMGMTGGSWPRWMAGDEMQVIRNAGLQVRSVMMFGPGWKEPLLDQAIALAKEQGFQYYILSLNESSIEKEKLELEDLKNAAQKMKENGIEFLIHNHETEWMDDNGTCVFDFLMENIPDLRVELDVGWVKFAKRDCIDIMKKYGKRIRIIHFKDICEDACQENRRNCFTAIGEGSIPLKEIVAQAKNLDLDEIGFVIDQDNSNGDMMRDIQVGLENIRSYYEGENE